MSTRSILLFIFTLLVTLQLTAKPIKLGSPDGNMIVRVETEEALSWSVEYKGEIVLENVTIGLVMNGGDSLGRFPKLHNAIGSVENKRITVSIPRKDKIIADEYQQLILEFTGNFAVSFRVYNEGVAYQFITDLEGVVEVDSELLDIRFPSGTTSLFPIEQSLYSHFEPYYIPTRIDTLTNSEFCSLPVLFRTREKVNILFSEAALHDYPALFLEGNEDNSLHAKFPKYVLETAPNLQNSPDRNEIITKEATYIARTEGKRAFPWRVFIIGSDARLVETNLIFQLSRPEALGNMDWIKPGKVAWDWYNVNNIFGVDFRSGLNTETYRYFIDFASDNGIEYVILDEGWTRSTLEIMDCNPQLDIRELITYGKSKDVGIIVWVLWKPLNENMDDILDTYSRWGAKGIKVDFMQRADQFMVNSYETIAREAAERELLVDFHGAFKPAGLERVYPNVLSYEAVKGNENSKWSRDIHPEHNVTLPFTRMVAGPMDYTPGSMENRQERNFFISYDRPMTMGTRCHQVAMYVVYESPLQMLCENPSIYRKEQETVEYISRIPTVWDETIVLEAIVADCIVVARRSDDDWYIGAMTDWTPREFIIDLSFLGDAEYSLEIMQDGVNAGRYAEDYKRVNTVVNKDSKLSMQLASGGGWVGILKKME